jgi:hypothetical protein
MRVNGPALGCVAASLALFACSSPGTGVPAASTSTTTATTTTTDAATTASSGARPLIPNKLVNISQHNVLTLEKLYVAGLAGLALYLVVDPFAPNWSLEEAALGEDTYYVRMQAKRFRTGGDGEAMLVLKRRAMQLQRERGFEGYRILDYSEGIESQTPVAQRFSEGIVRLVRSGAVRP